MSSLIFYTDETQAFVVTDTLAVTYDSSGQAVPHLFTSKALYVPHLRMVVAGTGLGGMTDRWFAKINTQMLVDGVEHLNSYAQQALAELWQKHLDSPHAIEGKTTTIYHFGISEVTGKVVAYAFRSKSGFTSETLPHGTATKPGVPVPDGNLIQNIEAIMQQQRDVEEGSSSTDRIHIGGQAIAIHLTAKQCTHQVLFHFNDYQAHADQAYLALQRARESK
ncbi:hypothetical protein VDG07_12720 [Xanthomonas campestris pv. raphani]|uniref:hypothetical protein n=1 Tax=Xanthomonas campestris TaxID=339 RepID=UPI002B238A6C|nr:hypothetical protein [Xanthomonas campestris]MEA9796195.1 hypothetical protein [Xanthomonas campestris pv. raphani]